MTAKFQAGQKSNLNHRKPLIYVIAVEQSTIPELLTLALEGRERVEFSRAELELKKALRLMALMTGGNASSLPFLSALSLPGPTTAILWTANALLSIDTERTDIDPEKTNRDSLHLLQALNHVSLNYWYEDLVEKVSISSIPAEIKFLPGHPIAGKLYRQHPLESKQEYYYPVDSYYSLIYDEREAELIQILSDLGATKIVIDKPQRSRNAGTKTIENDDLVEIEDFSSGTFVFDYIGRNWSPNLNFDTSKYIWLDYEPMWKSVVNGRISNGALSASFEINIDFSNTIAGKLEGIEGLVNEMESINYIDLEALLKLTLRKRRVQVKFAGDGTNSPNLETR